MKSADSSKALTSRIFRKGAAAAKAKGLCEHGKDLFDKEKPIELATVAPSTIRDCAISGRRKGHDKHGDETNDQTSKCGLQKQFLLFELVQNFLDCLLGTEDHVLFAKMISLSLST